MPAEAPILVAARAVWTGVDPRPIADAVIAIADGRVTGVGPRTQVAQPPRARVVEFPEATILPGLIDTHVHVVWPGDGTPNDVFTKAASDHELLLRAVRNAQTTLRAGVTTVRDLGSRGRVVLDLRDAIARRVLAGPRILAAGPPITITGGHMHYFGGEADGAADLRRVARGLWRMGVDLFKVVADGGGTPRTHGWIPTYTQDELAVVAEEAHSHETHVTVHANTIEAIRRSVQAGVNGIEHGSLFAARDTVSFDDALVDEIARRGIHLGHTLTGPYRSMERAQQQWATLGEAERAYWDTRRRTWEARLENYGRMLRRGVKLVAATDAGWSLVPFGEYALALELIVRAGASPHEALLGATRLAAEAIGLSDQIGTLEPGKIADLTVIAGDPFTDISAIWRVHSVMRGGEFLVEGGRLN